MSSPLKAARPPLHSLPSGTTLRSAPSTLGTRTLSNVPKGPPSAAGAALHAAVPVFVPPPAAHAADRLIGETGAPWAKAGRAGIRTATVATPARAAGRRTL